MAELRKRTLDLLAEIENRIDPETEEDYVHQWDEFLHHRFTGDVFSPKRKKLSASALPRDRVLINDTLDDFDNMLYSQLLGVSDNLNEENGGLGIRANYGSAIMATVFGAEPFILPPEMDTLPTTRTYPGDDALDRLLDAGMPSIYHGLGQKVFDAGEQFREIFSHYPKIDRYVEIYHPDLQGPLDNCELLLNGEVFYIMYDEPEKVLAFMQVLTDSYREFIDKWFTIVPPKGEIHNHWNSLMHPGLLVVRDDSAMNLSPEFYTTFARPFDAQLIEHYGGVIHFCGRGDHYVPLLKEIPNLHGINMSQPHLNDMEKIYRSTVDCGLQILGFSRERAFSDVGNRPEGFHSNLSVAGH